MIKKIEFIAEDGNTFATEKECREHENILREQQKTMVQSAIKSLDAEIWKKYHPDVDVKASEPELRVAHVWLKNDIVEILCDETLSVDVEDILSIIKKNDFSEVILNDYISIDEIAAEVNVRKDFKKAFSKVESGRELSYVIGYALGKRDLKKLAALHKEGKYREKIEDLLEDCNFHYECEKFHQKEYDEFLEA